MKKLRPLIGLAILIAFVISFLLFMNFVLPDMLNEINRKQP